jgi:hypothetical protein
MRGLEPDAYQSGTADGPPDADDKISSIAISLKRIADALEYIVEDIKRIEAERG